MPRTYTTSNGVTHTLGSGSGNNSSSPSKTTSSPTSARDKFEARKSSGSITVSQDSKGSTVTTYNNGNTSSLLNSGTGNVSTITRIETSDGKAPTYQQAQSYTLNNYGLTVEQTSDYIDTRKQEIDRYSDAYKQFLSEGHGSDEDRARVAAAEARANNYEQFDRDLKGLLSTQQSWGENNDGTVHNMVGNSGSNQAYFDMYKDSLQYKTTQGNINDGATIVLSDGTQVTKRYADGYGQYYEDQHGNIYDVNAANTDMIQKSSNVYSYSVGSTLLSSGNTGAPRTSPSIDYTSNIVNGNTQAAGSVIFGNRYIDTTEGTITMESGNKYDVGDFGSQFVNNLEYGGSALSYIAKSIGSIFGLVSDADLLEQKEEVEKLRERKVAQDLYDTSIVKSTQEDLLTSGLTGIMDPTLNNFEKLPYLGQTVGGMLIPADGLELTNRLAAGDSIGSGEGDIPVDTAVWGAIDVGSIASSVVSAGAGAVAKIAGAGSKAALKSIDAAGDIAKVGTKIDDVAESTKKFDLLGDERYFNNQKSVTEVSDLKGIKSERSYIESPEYRDYHTQVNLERSADLFEDGATVARNADNAVDVEKAASRARELEELSASASKLSKASGITSGVLAGGALAYSGIELAGALLGRDDGSDNQGGKDPDKKGDTPNPDTPNPDETSNQGILDIIKQLLNRFGSGGTPYGEGDGYSSESGGGSGDVWQSFLTAAKNYGPYIIIGVCVLVAIYVLSNAETKTSKKRSMKI